MDPELQQQRDAIEQRLAEFRQFYGGQAGQDLQGQMQSRASGAQVPFSSQVMNSLMGANADGAAAGARNQSEMARQGFANAGMGGSGAEMSALMNIRRAASRSTRQGRQEITSRAGLENFQAQERAQRDLQAYLAAQAAQQQAATAMEVDYRSKFHKTSQGDTGTQDLGTGAPAAPDPRIEEMRKKFGGQNPYLSQLSFLQQPTWGGAGQQFHSNAALEFSRAQGNQQQEQYANRKSALQSQADAWEAQKAGFYAQHGF